MYVAPANFKIEIILLTVLRTYLINSIRRSSFLDMIFLYVYPNDILHNHSILLNIQTLQQPS